MLSRVSLIEKEDNVSIDLYKNISICLDEFIKQLNYKSFKHHIYAVDGTNVTMDKEHSKHGYPSNQNPYIAFGYIMGLYFRSVRTEAGYYSKCPYNIGFM